MRHELKTSTKVLLCLVSIRVRSLSVPKPMQTLDTNSYVFDVSLLRHETNKALSTLYETIFSRNG